MQERIEFRINEADAEKYLRPTDGVRLGRDSDGRAVTRKVETSVGDPLFARIGELQRRFKAAGDCFFLGWQIRRKYTKAELAAAEAFRLIVKHKFEPAGEEHGTGYDESSSCKYCGAGALRTTELILPPSRLPRRGKLALARTIAGELVASEAFAHLFQANAFRGAEFQPIRRAGNTQYAVAGWYALVLTAPPVTIVSPTQAGTAPFGELDWEHPPLVSAAKRQEYRKEDWAELIATDPRWLEWSQASDRRKGWADRHTEYRCPLGHTIGLNLLSELSVSRANFAEWDFAATAQNFGVRRGLLRPEPEFIASRRLYESLHEAGLKGVTFEVAHLI